MSFSQTPRDFWGPFNFETQPCIPEQANTDSILWWWTSPKMGSGTCEESHIARENNRPHLRVGKPKKGRQFFSSSSSTQNYLPTWLKLPIPLAIGWLDIELHLQQSLQHFFFGGMFCLRFHKSTAVSVSVVVVDVPLKSTFFPFPW